MRSWIQAAQPAVSVSKELVTEKGGSDWLPGGRPRPIPGCSCPGVWSAPCTSEGAIKGEQAAAARERNLLTGLELHGGADDGPVLLAPLVVDQVTLA